MTQSIRDLIDNDAYAITFQTMGQYRTALLKAIDDLELQHRACHINAIPDVPSASAQLAEPAAWEKRWYGYSTLFNAISDAVSVTPHGAPVAIKISVDKFEEAMLRAKRLPASYPKDGIAIAEGAFKETMDEARALLAAQPAADAPGEISEDERLRNMVRAAIALDNNSERDADRAYVRQVLSDVEAVNLDTPDEFNSGYRNAIQEIRSRLTLGGWYDLAAPAAEPAQIPYLPYLSDCADGVKGHYAIARWNPAGYHEAWNLHSHRWASCSDEVLTLEQATDLLRKLVIPTSPAMSASPAALTDARDEIIKTQRETLERTWHVLKKHGAHPGRTDDFLHDCVDRALSAAHPDRQGVALSDYEIERTFYPSGGTENQLLIARSIGHAIERMVLSRASSSQGVALPDKEAFEAWLADECINVTYDDALYIWRAARASSSRAEVESVPEGILDALRFYANGSHFTMHDSSAWDTVSGEPQNFYEDESNTATVEDGSIAKLALQGKFFADTECKEPAVEGEVFGVAKLAEPAHLDRQGVALSMDELHALAYCLQCIDRHWRGEQHRNTIEIAEKAIGRIFDVPNETRGLVGYSCAKRVADPENEHAACRKWCGNETLCITSSPAAQMAESRQGVALSDKEAFEAWLADECISVTYDDALYIWRAARASSSRAEVELRTAEMPNIKAMVDRFLGWKLPRDFSPDCGVSFTPPENPEWGPVGTNLLNADQARQMFEYVLAAQPAEPGAEAGVLRHRACQGRQEP